MSKKNYVFMGHQKGQFEGTNYDNLLISNGARTCKFKNTTGLIDFSIYQPEKTLVNIEFGVVFGPKEVPHVSIDKISPVV